MGPLYSLVTSVLFTVCNQSMCFNMYSVSRNLLQNCDARGYVCERWRWALHQGSPHRTAGICREVGIMKRGPTESWLWGCLCVQGGLWGSWQKVFSWKGPAAKISYHTILMTGTESFQVQDKEARPFFTVLNSSNELGLGIKQKGISTEIKSELSSAEPGCIISGFQGQQEDRYYKEARLLMALRRYWEKNTGAKEWVWENLPTGRLPSREENKPSVATKQKAHDRSWLHQTVWPHSPLPSRLSPMAPPAPGRPSQCLPVSLLSSLSQILLTFSSPLPSHPKPKQETISLYWKEGTRWEPSNSQNYLTATSQHTLGSFPDLLPR